MYGDDTKVQKYRDVVVVVVSFDRYGWVVKKFSNQNIAKKNPTEPDVRRLSGLRGARRANDCATFTSVRAHRVCADYTIRPGWLDGRK